MKQKNYEATEKNKDRNDFHNLFSFLCFPLHKRQSHEIHDLEIYTQYIITIQVFNPEGMGPSTSVVCMTDEGGE
jgi:hypothetical protein